MRSPKMIKMQQDFEWYYRNGYITTRDGNACIKDGEGFMVTSSGVRKNELLCDDYVIVNKMGDVLERPVPGAKPSIETSAHLLALTAAEETASVHVHSPNTVALFDLFKDKEDRLEKSLNTGWPELFRYTKVGKTVKFLEPGSFDLHDAIDDSFNNRHINFMRNFHATPDIVVMQRHGVIAVGESLEHCREHIHRLEHISTILLKILASGRKLEEVL